MSLQMIGKKNLLQRYKPICLCQFVISFKGGNKLLLFLLNTCMLFFRWCSSDTEVLCIHIIDIMVWIGFYLKTVNLILVAAFVSYISLTLAQSTTVGTIVNNDFENVSAFIFSRMIDYNLSEQWNAIFDDLCKFEGS